MARWGGEEFAGLLPETGMDQALSIAENMRREVQALRIPHESSLANHLVSISTGVASIVPSDTSSIDDLIKYADEALYRAKQNGRNRVEAAVHA